MIYYISDLHFFHRNIEDVDNRGFASLFEMHEYLISQWNNRVTDNDEVYIIGDFSFGRGVETWEVLSKLKGKLILVEGNHDYWYLEDREFVDTVFEEIVSYKEIIDSGRKVILSHYPHLFYNHQFDKEMGDYCTYMLYGHVHDTYDEYLLNRAINCNKDLPREHSRGQFSPTPFQMINVFCLFSDYVPLTLDEWIVIDKKRREMIDKHQDIISYDDWELLHQEVIIASKNGWK